MAHDKKPDNDGATVGIGIALGIALGAGIGAAMDDIAIGIAVGLAIGAGLSAPGLEDAETGFAPYCRGSSSTSGEPTS